MTDFIKEVSHSFYNKLNTGMWNWNLSILSKVLWEIIKHKDEKILNRIENSSKEKKILFNFDFFEVHCELFTAFIFQSKALNIVFDIP